MNEIYTYTVPTFIKMLGGLKNVLNKCEQFAHEKGMTDAEFLESRLVPDMFPFSRQIQIASDNAKGAVARLTGQEAPKYEDTEATFSELQARIDKTLAYVQSVPESAFAHAAEQKITLPYFPGKFMNGFGYTCEYVLPNFFFHVTTAYAIARMKGVGLGKMDYLNGLPLQDL
ncbi:DUF1993 domain-containing protein [bacterium]|nr:DUF1993 domain-containing protein [bacterium]